jgi:hypothetical protein
MRREDRFDGSAQRWDITRHRSMTSAAIRVGASGRGKDDVAGDWQGSYASAEDALAALQAQVDAGR